MINIKKYMVYIILAILVVTGFILLSVKTDNNNKKADLKRKNEAYVKVLFAEGDFMYFNNHIVAERLYINKNKLIIYIAFYNLKTGDKATADEIIGEYQRFLSGDTDSGQEMLNKYYNSMTDGRAANIGDVDTFYNEVLKEIEEKQGETLGMIPEKHVYKAIGNVLKNHDISVF